MSTYTRDDAVGKPYQGLQVDDYGREFVTRWVITHLSKEGARVLAQPQQGRHTFATSQEAQAFINAIMTVNTMSTIESVYGLPLEVRSCPCYPGHFDPMQYVFE